jgi:activating signal cointegrator complex subunit 3
VRHNEDQVNAELSRSLRFGSTGQPYDSPNLKANFLMQMHFGRVPPPMSDYATDLKSVLENSLRVVQAMVDVAADSGHLSITLSIMTLSQSITQAVWHDTPPLLALPNITAPMLQPLARRGFTLPPHLIHSPPRRVLAALQEVLPPPLADETARAIARLPRLRAQVSAESFFSEGGFVDVVVTLELAREGGGGDGYAVAPRFPKPKREGWWVLVGSEADDELLAMRRVGGGGRGGGGWGVTTASLRLSVESGWVGKGLTAFVISDTYVGLDQQIALTVPPPQDDA